MEVTRTKVDSSDFRVRQLRAQQMLRGELAGKDLSVNPAKCGAAICCRMSSISSAMTCGSSGWPLTSPSRPG